MTPRQNEPGGTYQEANMRATSTHDVNGGVSSQLGASGGATTNQGGVLNHAYLGNRSIGIAGVNAQPTNRANHNPTINVHPITHAHQYPTNQANSIIHTYPNPLYNANPDPNRAITVGSFQGQRLDPENMPKINVSPSFTPESINCINGQIIPSEIPASSTEFPKKSTLTKGSYFNVEKRPSVGFDNKRRRQNEELQSIGPNCGPWCRNWLK